MQKILNRTYIHTQYKIQKKLNTKNPAYGRYRISWPMRIVASIFLVSAGVQKGADSIFLCQTFFLHSPPCRSCRRRRLPRNFWATTTKINKITSLPPFNLEHLNFFRAACEGRTRFTRKWGQGVGGRGWGGGEGGGGGLRPIWNTSLFLGLHARADSVHVKMRTRSTLENCMERGQQTTNDTRTLRLLDRIGPVGQFGKNI